jgi:hypothetical protein
MYAAEKGYYELAKVILENNGNIDLKDTNDW